jgi:hypothetical protein
MAEQGVNTHRYRHRSDTMLRVAAFQLPRLEPEDRERLLPFVKRDLAQHEMTD